MRDKWEKNKMHVEVAKTERKEDHRVFYTIKNYIYSRTYGDFVQFGKPQFLSATDVDSLVANGVEIIDYTQNEK